MVIIIIPLILAVVAADSLTDPASYQLFQYRNKTKVSIGTLTTGVGAPVEYEEATSVLNTKLIYNAHYLDNIMSVVRERIPGRIVHAPGAGASGYFNVTHDISHICKAKLFSKVGKITPVRARFSTGFSDPGARDTVRETRGFAVKFYTGDGIFDLPALNNPVFPFKNPLLFNTLTHALKRNPVTNLPDHNMLVDYLIRHPESIFTFLHLLSDYGLPAGYEHMPAYPIHTYQVYNEKGVSSFMKFHFIPVLGVKNFNLTEAAQLATGDSDYYARRLYNSIENGNGPSWYLKAQIFSEEDRKNCGFDIFDVTLVPSIKDYPLHSIGIITLNKNPTNYFAEIEQLAFCPGNLVPGVMGSPDVMFESRCLAYKDAHNYRLGANSRNIPVNCPMQNKPLNYLRDGSPPVNDNGGGAPNYYPNSFNGPVPYVDKKRPKPVQIVEKPADNLKQAGEYYANELNSNEKNTLHVNLIGLLCSSEQNVKDIAIKWFTKVHEDLGNTLSAGLKAQCS